MADRPRYTVAQLSQFYERIALPKDKWLYSVSSLSGKEKYDLLDLLVRHTLLRIPFENLTLHYSWHRTINVRPQHLFNKIVRAPSRRGGYCMENNSLFHTVLLSLGFKAYMAGARVYDEEHDRYGGFSHCVNIVVIDGEKWMVDVGFGANGPTFPVLLSEHKPQSNPPCDDLVETRLVREPIPQAVDQEQRLWIYQHRLGPGEEWTPMYCFVDFEFLLEDIRGMNLSPWKSPHSWFTQKVVLVRFTMAWERDALLDTQSGKDTYASDEAFGVVFIDGVLILLQDSLKWRSGGKIHWQIRFKDEEQRVQAIKKYFGIELDEEDRAAIIGTIGGLDKRRMS
ncbi:hypothetical protein M426DRAFT_321983 [Hypoxylon sp. CI-4A]|nr:hypothetical protein M426DRAFT_321983 [Hypoxylon sp. CI-4A]